MAGTLLTYFTTLGVTTTTNVGNGSVAPMLTQPVLTVAEAQRAAAGETVAPLVARPGEFVRGIRSRLTDGWEGRPGDEVLVAAITGRAGYRSEWAYVGWPVANGIWSRSGVCSDMVAQTAGYSYGTPSLYFHASPSHLTWAWQTPTNRDSQVFILVENVCLFFALIVLAYYIGRALRVRRRWVLPLLVAVALAASTGVVDRYVHLLPDLGQRTRLQTLTDEHGNVVCLNAHPDLFVTGVTGKHVASLPDDAAGDAALLRAILRRVPEGPDDGLLAVAWCQDTQPTRRSTSVGSPWSWFTVSTTSREWLQESSATPAPYPQRGVQWAFEHGHVGAVLRSNPQPNTALEVWVSVPAIATTLLALWLVWQIAALPLWLWWGRTLRRRAARGECLACGYDLRVPAATST